MARISTAYQPCKIKKDGYTDWIDGGKFCSTTDVDGVSTAPPLSGLNLLDAFDVDWSAYKIDGLTASATSIINKLNTPATAINNFLGVLEDLDELLDSQDRSTKEGSYWIVGADIDIIIGEKTYKSLHTGDLVIINVGAHDEEIEDASGFELCYYCVLINMSGYLPLSGGEMWGHIDMLGSSIIWNDWDSSIGLLNGQLIITGGEGLVFNGATALFAGNIIPADGSQNIGYPDKLFNKLYINKIIPEEGIFYNDLFDDGRTFITVNEHPVFYTNIDDVGMRRFFLGLPDQEDCFDINVDSLDIYCTAGGTNIYGYLSVSNSNTSSNHGLLSIDTLGRLNIESETGINLNGQVYIPVNNNISWEDSDGAMHSLGIGNTRVYETPVLYTDSCYIDTLYANTVGTLSEPTLTVNTGIINLFPWGTARSKNLLTANRDKILSQISNEETEALKYFIHIDGIYSRGLETFPIDADYCDFAGGIKAGLDIEAVDGFKKTGSTDDYVLLAGGGTKALSEFTTDLSGYLRLIGGTMSGDILPDNHAPVIGHNFEREPGVIPPTYRSLGSKNSYFNKIYAREFKGLADNALQLYTYQDGYLTYKTPIAVNKGDASTPVYFKDGVPVECTGTLPTNQQITNWNLAHGWGDHSKAGYVTSSGVTAVYVGDGLYLEGLDELHPTSLFSIMSEGRITLKLGNDTQSEYYSNSDESVEERQYGVGLDADGNLSVNVPWTDTYHKHTAGTGISISDTTADGDSSHNVKINLLTATTSAIGGIQLGYTQTGQNYPVQLSSNKAYVNVPWENTDSKVTQSRSTSNGAYPLLCKYDTKPGESTTNSVNFVSEVTVNPSTGAVNAQAFYETSDIRKKEIKSDLSLDKCYDLIDKCQTVIYSLKDLTQELVGMIAQEIEEFFPEVVATDEEGFKSLAYDRLVVICFKVLKDVIKRLEKLENEL